MFTFLLVLHGLIAAALVAVILMQRSEGGGLGTGTGPAGLMTARGAADFLTRTTAILAVLFVGMSIVLAAYAGVSRAPAAIDTTFAREAKPMAPVTGGAPAAALPSPLGGLPSGVPGVPAPGAAGLTAPVSSAPTTADTNTEPSKRKSSQDETKARNPDEASSTTSSKKRRSDSDEEAGSRSSKGGDAASSAPPPRETPKAGTVTPSTSVGASQIGGSFSLPSGNAGAPATTPKSTSTPIPAPAPAATGTAGGSGNSQ